MLQVVASVMIVILKTLKVSLTLLESSIMLLENIYSTGVTHADCHATVQSFITLDPGVDLIKMFE